MNVLWVNLVILFDKRKRYVKKVKNHWSRAKIHTSRSKHGATFQESRWSGNESDG